MIFLITTNNDNINIERRWEDGGTKSFYATISKSEIEFWAGERGISLIDHDIHDKESQIALIMMCMAIQRRLSGTISSNCGENL